MDEHPRSAEEHAVRKTASTAKSGRTIKWPPARLVDGLKALRAREGNEAYDFGYIEEPAVYTDAEIAVIKRLIANHERHLCSFDELLAQISVLHAAKVEFHVDIAAGTEADALRHGQNEQSDPNRPRTEEMRRSHPKQ